MKAGEMRRVMLQHAKSSNAPFAVNIEAKGVYGGIRHNSIVQMSRSKHGSIYQ